jgi:molybdenum cofactor synthesis domain-containing protein
MYAAAPDLTLAEARSLALESVQPLDTEFLRPDQAAGRVLREDVASDVDFPGADVSTMDGFCLRSGDIGEAEEGRPVDLEVIGEAPAGCGSKRVAEPGQCVEVATGGRIAEGTDAVVPLEMVERRDPGRIVVRGAVKPWSFVRRRGRMAERGEVVAKKGRPVRPGTAALLAACAGRPVEVTRVPRVAVVMTGSELLDPLELPKEGGERASSGAFLAAAIGSLGGVVRDVCVVRDDLEEIAGTVERTGRESDLVVITGGTSGGKYDFTAEALAHVGARMVFRGVAITPGAGTILASLGRCPVLALPGSPAAVVCGYAVLVRLLVLGLLGCSGALETGGRGFLQTGVTNRSSSLELVPARWRPGPAIEVLESDDRADLCLLRDADCVILVEPDRRLKRGAEVDIEFLGWPPF